MGMGGHWLCEKKTGGEEIQNQFGEGAAALKKMEKQSLGRRLGFSFVQGDQKKSKGVGGAAG